MILKSMGIQRSRWVSPWLQWGLLEQPRLTDRVVTISEVGVEEEHGGQYFGMHVDNVDLRCVWGWVLRGVYWFVQVESEWMTFPIKQHTQRFGLQLQCWCYWDNKLLKHQRCWESWLVSWNLAIRTRSDYINGGFLHEELERKREEFKGWWDVWEVRDAWEVCSWVPWKFRTNSTFGVIFGIPLCHNKGFVQRKIVLNINQLIGILKRC